MITEPVTPQMMLMAGVVMDEKIKGNNRKKRPNT